MRSRAERSANLVKQLPKACCVAGCSAKTRIYVELSELLHRRSKLRKIHGSGKFKRRLRLAAFESPPRENSQQFRIQARGKLRIGSPRLRRADPH